MFTNVNGGAGNGTHTHDTSIGKNTAVRNPRIFRTFS